MAVVASPGLSLGPTVGMPSFGELADRSNDHIGDSLTGLAVPQRWSTGRLNGLSAADTAERRHEAVPADQLVRAMCDGDWAFGVGPQGEARNPEYGRLLLHPPGVRQHCDRSSDQTDELDVSDGLGELDAGMTIKPGLSE